MILGLAISRKSCNATTKHDQHWHRQQQQKKKPTAGFAAELKRAMGKV